MHHEQSLMIKVQSTDSRRAASLGKRLPYPGHFPHVGTANKGKGCQQSQMASAGSPPCEDWASNRELGNVKETAMPRCSYTKKKCISVIFTFPIP